MKIGEVFLLSNTVMRLESFYIEVAFLIIAIFLIVRGILIVLAKKSDIYLEFVIDGIKPLIDKLYQDQPKRYYYVQRMDSLQKYKRFSSEDYLMVIFAEDNQLFEYIND